MLKTARLNNPGKGCQPLTPTYANMNEAKKAMPTASPEVKHNWRFEDITGRRFGKLLVVSFAESRKTQYVNGPQTTSYWKCLCDCGNSHVVSRRNLLKSGNPHTCGCSKIGNKFHFIHGHGGSSTRKAGVKVKGKTRTYTIWAGMLGRTTRENSPDYPLYGGRGIKVCKRWKRFENFLADMGEAPDWKSIDRIDTNGDYRPGNCRWATSTEQARNTRRTRFVKHEGERLCVTEWAHRTGLPIGTIYGRLDAGWTAERALTTPLPKGNYWRVADRPTQFGP